MFKFKSKKKYKNHIINPEDIFFDDKNVSDFDVQQMEGVVEKPIKKITLYIYFFVCLIIFIIFSFRLFSLQVVRGDYYNELSKKNMLRAQPIFAERGVIYDKNGIELAWNTQEPERTLDFLFRKYTDLPGIGHVLGYVKYPQTDEKGLYWRTEISGQTGIESGYNDILQGKNGSVLNEVDALGKIISENKISEPESGKNLSITIDAKLQSYLYTAIEKKALESKFNAGAGIIMDIETGEILSFTSYPEFDPYILAEGEDTEAINSFFSDQRKPFLNRITKGLYSPGSIVKPFLALAALNEGLITENTSIYSYGHIEIPNPYNPSNPSIFRDWRDEGHGLTDVRHAIADSVNTFFYAIGGGYKNQQGLGISRIEEYLSDFGFAKSSGIDFGTEIIGIIPTPEWKKEKFSDGTWRLGDTYNTSIGQFGFQVTPIQMVTSIAALANYGNLVTPILVEDERKIKKVSIDINKQNYDIIHSAMRDTVTKGTAQNINVSFIDIAAKTGTAQVGRNNEFYNSWAVGFFPYKEPKYAFTLVMERAPKESTGSASGAMSTFIKDVEQGYPEFWDSFNSKEE